MRQRPILALLLVASVALGAGYFFGRSHLATHAANHDQTPGAAQSSLTLAKSNAHGNAATDHKPVRIHEKSHYTVNPTPLPAADTPLTETYAQLKALADAGDAQAASRLYRDLQRCSQARDIQRSLPQMERFALNRPAASDNASPAQLNRQEGMLDLIQKRMDLVSDSQAFCAGVSDQQLASLTPATLQAAQQGDEQATDCYLGSNLSRMSGVLDHPEWLTDYKQNALQLADTALQNGDWTAVRLMQWAYGGGNYSSSLLGQLTGTDPEQSYRYLQLQQLGTSGGSDPRLDKRIATAQQQLTPQQISDANAWASQTYSQYFNSPAPDLGRGSMPDCLYGGSGR